MCVLLCLAVLSQLLEAGHHDYQRTNNHQHTSMTYHYIRIYMYENLHTCLLTCTRVYRILYTYVFQKINSSLYIFKL